MSVSSHSRSPPSAPLAQTSPLTQEAAGTLHPSEMLVVRNANLAAAVGALVFIVVLCLAGFCAKALAENSTSGTRALEIEYFYDAPTNPDLREIYARLSGRDPLAQLSHYLSPLRLPRKLVFRTTECGKGENTRAYAPGKDLVVCYEYLQRAERLASNAKDPEPNSDRDFRAVIANGAFAHAILSLVAQATFDQLQTPIWGNRIDAADRLAALVMVQLDPGKAADWFVGAATYFALSGAETPADLTSLKLPDSQLFYDHFCFAQLAGPAAFAKLVDIAAGKLFDGADAEKLKRVFGAFAMTDTDSRMKAVEGLDPNDKIFQTRFYRRLRLCPQEVAEARAAFDREIRPHIVAAKK